VHRQRDAERPGLRQRQLVSVDALVALGQRPIVGVADEPDRHTLFVPEVREGLLDLPGEFLGDGGGLVLVPQRYDDVLDTCTARLTLFVTQLTEGLHSANLDALDVVGDDDLLVLECTLDFVVPDLHLDATILRSALFVRVRGHRLRVADPLVGDPLRRQREHLLEVLGDLSGPLARQARVVPEDARQRARERLRIRVSDEMEAHVLAVPHALEDRVELVDVARRNLRDARFEVDRRDDVLQLDGLELLDGDLLDRQLVAVLAVEPGRILRPAPVRLVAGKMALDRLARLDRVDRIGDGEAGDQGSHQEQGKAMFDHAGHLPSGTCALGRLIGAPRRQKISGSMSSG
jgi:hypothetical protein